MANFVISNAQRAKYAIWCLLGTITFFHCCALMFAIAAVFSAKSNIDGPTLKAMFSTCVTGIGVSSSILYAGEQIFNIFIAKVTKVEDTDARSE